MASKRPLYDKILVKENPTTTESKGGIILPKGENANKTGTVVQIGQGIRLSSNQIRPLTVVVGDNVMIGEDSGIEINVDGENLLLMKESDVICILGEQGN